MAEQLAQPHVRIRIRYVFGILSEDGQRQSTLEIGPDQTVLDVLRTLDLSRLELLTAVNGETVSDATILHDGDELTLIPAIQGG